MKTNRKINKESSVKNRKNQWLLKFSLLFLLVLGLSLGIGYAVHTVRNKFFHIKEIVFYGNKHLTGSELKALMGLKGNEGLLKVSSEELASRLLKSPWIRSVSFRKDFPHRFLLKIDETMPLALIEIKNHTFFIDDRGHLLEEIKSDSVPFLPIIMGDLFKNNATQAEVLSLAKAMKEKGFNNMKNRVEIIVPRGSRPEDISMQVDGTFIKVGDGEYEDKLERLIELEGEIAQRRIPVDYIDLRFANKVVVKPINEVIR